MMAPNTHDHNLVVKVLSKRSIVDRTTSDGRHVAHAIFVVADNTGCMNLDAHDGMFVRLFPKLYFPRALVPSFILTNFLLQFHFMGTHASYGQTW